MVVQDKPNYRDISQGESGSNDRKQRLRERFEVVKKLGQGTYGKVQLAINKETKQEVAIKTIKKAKIENEQDLVRIRREIQIMSSIHHPHIIHIYEVFENQEKIVLIMQYASGGELYDYLGCRRKLDENEARRVFRQVASAIFYCHKNRICHRDLKLENILLDDRGNAKIADFGLSNVFDERWKLKTFCGSPLYASPEIVRGTPYSGPEVDCWSLGVLLFTLVYGAMPFDGSNFKRLVKQISEGEYFEPKEKSGASGLIRRLLTVDINLRATIRDICADWWVNQGYDHSLLKVASDMANLTPVRLDLLLAISSSSSQAADQSVKNPAATTPKPAESRNALCNGYYSKSHPLRVPVSGERRTVTGADGYSAYSTYAIKDTGKQQIFNTVNSAQKYEEPLLVDVKKTTSVAQTLAADKNENNTFVIVQDLIKDVISKVEQHINISKMELLRNTEAKQPLGDGSKSNDVVVKSTETPKEAHKVESQQSLPEGAIRKCLFQKISEATATEKNSQKTQSLDKTFVGLGNVIGKTKISGVLSGSNKPDTKTSPEKIVEMEAGTLSEKRKKSIPNICCDLQSRKSAIQVMDPDVVIPIFNVCSSIPKRSQDSVRIPPKDTKLKETLRTSSSWMSESNSKAIDCTMKPNDEPLSESENKSIISFSHKSRDTMSNSQGKDFAKGEIGSPVLNCSNEIPQTSEKTHTGVSDMQESSTDTEAPKLPPRKRFLIKIPKQEKDIAPPQCESQDLNKVNICDKQESSVPQGESRTLREKEKLELQEVGKDSESLTGGKEKRSSVGSQEDVSQSINKIENVESTPKLCQRKSRRDCSKRSLSFNIKTNMNREPDHIISEKQNRSVIKMQNTESPTNTAAKELNCSSEPITKCSKRGEVFKDSTPLLISPTEQGNNSTQKISCSASGEMISVNSEEHSKALTTEKRREMLESEMKSIDIASRNVDFVETEKTSKHEPNDEQNMENNFRCVQNNSGTSQQDSEEMRSRPLVKSKQRSLSRTRAMSMEFESLALMPIKIVGPPKKPPGKVEIPKNFDPTQIVTSPKAEMKEIIFIPTACVSENKEKIQKKIERVKKAAIVIPPRRKSDAGITSRKKKYTRSKTDFIIRPDNLDISAEDSNLVMDDIQQEAIYRDMILQDNQEDPCPENEDGEIVSSEMWYSIVSPDNESEECEQRFKAFGERDESADTFDGFYNDNDVAHTQNNQLHRHSVDTESGYWTPPEIVAGERSISQTNMKMRDEKISKNSEKIMLQRAAFRNSKMRMKLSDEGLDMCSLSSSLESGIYSWRQEEINGKRISPDSESALKILSPQKFAEMTSDGSYAAIARSFKKMTFPPEHSSTSELSENCSVVGDAEKNVGTHNIVVAGRDNRTSQRTKSNGVNSKHIKSSDSQSSYGSNDISDDVFETWVEKEDGLHISKNDSLENTDNNSAPAMNKNSRKERKAGNWQRGETWHNYSTDKESSDNDDDLDLMIDESYQGVYGTEGLWQFLKSVNQHLSNQMKTSSKKMSPKSLCHRSKSQESKHPDDIISHKRPVTRSLSREEKQRKESTQLRHFVSEGKLTSADSMDCLEGPYTRLDDTRYSSGYMASGSSLEDTGMLQKDFMSSVDSLQSHSNDISIYGTLRKDRYLQSSSALSSPCMIRRKKSLQNPYSSVDLGNTFDDTEDVANDDLLKHSSITEQNRKLSLYGTLRPRHLSQQGRTQSQILLSTDDGYQLLYNERSKKDSDTRHGSLGSLTSSVGKATSELNVSKNSIKDYEKMLLPDPSVTHRNTSTADSTYHTSTEKQSSRVKKIVSDKGNRRVSFSSDVKASKSDYHTSLRQNSLNKVREANEELFSKTNYKSNVYEEEQDSGSLLEALKTYGYRGIMSQKLHSNSDKCEPLLNYRLPTECFLTTGLNNTDWDNFEYLPVESTFAYQQATYSPVVDPMEYYPCQTFTKSSQKKRNTGALSCDDDIMFNDIYRSPRRVEDDIISRRKQTHKLQDLNDLHLAHRDKYSGENWDAKLASSTRKKGFDSTIAALSNERRNSGSEKILQHERERDKEEGFASADNSETRGSKQTENSIEILSEKIQALKSRCQRKSFDESKLKKEVDDSGILTNETQGSEKTSVPDAERLHGYADSAEDLSAHEGESSESVSDRIWRKSFYSRFNDVSTTRRKKSFLDSEFLGGHSFLRSSGKFNMDEEGGVEEPWTNTTMKRRNSHRTLPRQAVIRASSLNSDKRENVDCISGYYKRGAAATDSEYKNSTVSERKTNMREQSMPVICDKTSLHPQTTDELENICKVDKIRPNIDQIVSNIDRSQENRTDTTELLSSPDTDKNNLTDVRPARSTCDRTENLASRSEPATNLPKGIENIPEMKPDVTEGGSLAGDCGVSNISAKEPKSETSSTEDLNHTVSAKSKKVPEENLEKHTIDENPTKSTFVEEIDSQDHCRRPEVDKE